MSDDKNTRPNVPEGETEYYKTRQKAPNDKGFIGYETEWISFQKEAEYTTPKQP